MNPLRLSSSVSAAALGSLVVAAAFLAVLLAPPTAHAIDYDCADFNTQAEAQEYLLAGDPYRLDGDNDGVACESLPCPCSYGSPLPSPSPQPVPTPVPPPEEEEELVLSAYVACSLGSSAVAAHECPHRSKVGAFFRASREVAYTVCVIFPTGRKICTGGQVAQAGVLYVNKVTTNIVGLHKVVWAVEGRRLVRYFRRR